MRLQAVVVATAVVGLFGCDLLSPKIDQDLAQGLVKSILTKEKVEADKVECPADQKAEKGNKFECKATVGTVEIPFMMEVIDDNGTVSAVPKHHTLVVANIEDEIQADLVASGNEVAKIDCHDEVWVAVSGLEVACDVTDANGAKYLWNATFTDDVGGHRHSLTPQ